MAERNVLIGFPGITMSETRRSYGGDAKFVSAWLIEMFFELENYGSEQQKKLREHTERRLIRLDLSWSVKEQMRSEEAAAKCTPLTKDIIRIADESGIDRAAARQALLEDGGYELANLPDNLVGLIDEGRMDVVIFGQDRRARMNAKREDLRFRSFDLISLLQLFDSETLEIGISPIPRYERQSNQRRAKVKGPMASAMRTGPCLDESFEYVTYVELPTAEKRGLILVVPQFVIWHFGSIAIGDLAWTYKRFTDAVEAMDTFFNRVKPGKKAVVAEVGSEEEAEPDDEDDETPDPDVGMEDEDKKSTEASATAN